METRLIGNIDVSVVGLGCNNFGRRLDAERTALVVNAALDAEINFFDTADVYGQGQSEEYLGKALGDRRKSVVIATKFGNEMTGAGKGGHPDYVKQAAEASLRRLGTDYIDLYQMHVPDPHVPIAETLGALDDLVKAGKVLQIGSSNFSDAQIREAEAASLANNDPRFVTVQNHYSLLHREPEADVLPECAKLGLGFLPYFPLASGVLTGKVLHGQHAPEGSRLADSAGQNRWMTEHNMALAEALEQYATAKGHTLLELAFSWLLANPVVSSVIAGATRKEQIDANADATGWKLTKAELAEIDALAAKTV
jgi:aryl-alcohol dehydrogenase-like predicted oxidoreductase